MAIEISDDLEGRESPNSTYSGLQSSYVEWTRPKLDVHIIQSKLNTHEHFEVKSGYSMSGLPKFGDLTTYNTTEGEEIDLWNKEVARLVKIANSPKPIRLHGERDWFGEADRDGYIRLHKIAIQMQDALDVCIHDDELLLFEHMPSQNDEEYFHSVRERLLRGYEPYEGKERYQRHLSLQSYNDRYYHTLVNYITGTMLRVLLRTMRGTLWDEQCVVTLAKFAAKLKVLLGNLPKFVSLCLAKTEAAHFRKSQQYEQEYQSSSDLDMSDYEHEIGINSKKERKFRVPSRRIDAEMRYFIVMKTFHLGISRLLESALENLSSNEDTEMSADVFDTTALMYEDYITNRPLYICSQRDGTIGAAANPRVIESTGATFQVCFDIWESLEHETTPLNQMPAHWTQVSWKWTKIDPMALRPSANPVASTLNLSTMKSVIAALVPHSMACGSFPGLLQDMSNKASLISDPIAPLKLVKQDTFLALFNICTSGYMSNRHGLLDSDACRVLDSALAHGKDLSFPAPTSKPMFADSSRGVDDKALHLHREIKKRKMVEATKMFQRWVVDETSITIPNKLYAWGFLGACATLVLGGLAIGLSVGSRIPGVDPLGFASFCWVFAGFLLVVAKSLRVENWPWSQFFRGRVVCRSVSEVHSVTGLDSQVILAILLKLEPRMILMKKGPFNAVFSKRSKEGSSGFAIDIPSHITTLMEGGMTLVKVQSVVGDALVGIRSDLWTIYTSVSPKGGTFNNEMVVCRDFSDPAKWLVGATEYPLYTLTRDDLQWFRVVGLFENGAYFN